MTTLKDALRWLTPNGVIEAHRRQFRMNRLGLPSSEALATAVEECRYDLWPSALKEPDKPWTLVDVGANEGEFSAAAATLARLNGVHAFEPQPICHESLKKVLSKVPNSQCYPMAVGDAPGELELYCTANSRMASLLRPESGISASYTGNNFDVEERLKVPIATLDDALPQDLKIGLLKIDVQGYEISVLKGAERILQSTTALLLEMNYVPHYEGGATFDEVYQYVRSRGFQIFAISAPHIGRSAPGVPLWADALFVRS